MPFLSLLSPYLLCLLLRQQQLQSMLNWVSIFLKRNENKNNIIILDKLTVSSNIESMVMNSPLLQHKFLRTFSEGTFSDMALATKLFVQNHYAYSRNFPKYLQLIVDKLNAISEDTSILYENQEEEKGNYSVEQLANLQRHGIEAEWVAGIPHPQLLRSFLNKVGVTDNDIENPHTIGGNFARDILYLYDQSNPCEALAIIAFGIEKTVSHLYQYLWSGFEKQSFIEKKDYVFFPLHVLVDDGHADHLIESFHRLYEKDPGMCNTAPSTVETVLRLRAQMYTDLFALINTLSPPPPSSIPITEHQHVQEY